MAGRPHIDNASLNTLSDFYCADDPSAYSAGSVVHQAMWKFYHGIAVNGSTQSGIPRVSTDADFLVLYYWAADLVSASTYQDRYEMANRVMEIMENHSSLSSSGKQAWCDVGACTSWTTSSSAATAADSSMRARRISSGDLRATISSAVRSGEPPRNRTENPQIKSRNIINADRGRPQNIVVGLPQNGLVWSRLVPFPA